MNSRSSLLGWQGFWWLLLGCDPRGVSVGTEELCVADPTLALANSSAVPLSRCARIGVNELSNGGFESPLVADCPDGAFCQFPAADVQGWQTNSNAQVIEIWHDLYLDVPAPEGGQFVELDATSPDTLSQDVALAPGQLMYWSLVHRGRNGIESMAVAIGPSEAPSLQAVLASPADAWYPYSGLYRVGADEPTTRLSLVSLVGASAGNLVDAIIFAQVY